MPRRDDDSLDRAFEGPTSPDPRRIESLSVTESDVIDALEAVARSDRDIVLRVTPPFSGRMRARIHDASVVDADGGGRETGEQQDRDGEDSDPTGGGANTTGTGDSTGETDASPIHIPPARFVADPPAYPTVDDTEDELRASATPYTTERHRKRHQTAVEAWREAVRERLVESVTLDADDGQTAVSVAYLG
jgi:hypothetical protein